MIKSKITTTVKGDDKFKKLQQMLSKYKEAFVTIGIHDDAGNYPDGQAVVEVALWNEFGTRNIPQRSFFRSAIDENESKINAWREEAIANILDKDWPIEKALEMVGLRIQFLIQNKIKSNIPPENSPATKAAKLADGVAPSTLIWSGLMLRSVGFKVTLK